MLVLGTNGTPHLQTLVHQFPVQRLLEVREEETLAKLEQGGRNVAACLIYERGNEMTRKCGYCVSGTKGKFKKCVVLKGFFGSICANCKYGDQGTRCDHHEGSQKSRKRRQEGGKLHYIWIYSSSYELTADE